MVNITTQLNKAKHEKAIGSLRQNLINKGIYKPHLAVKTDVAPFNPKINDIKDPSVRAAMREVRLTGISAEE